MKNGRIKQRLKVKLREELNRDPLPSEEINGEKDPGLMIPVLLDEIETLNETIANQGKEIANQKLELTNLKKVDTP